MKPGMSLIKHYLQFKDFRSEEYAYLFERMGIINYVKSVNEIDAFTYATARTIAQNAPLSISVMKEQLRTLAGAHTMSPQDFERIQGLRRVVYNSHDYAEGKQAFKDKRQPQFLGR